MNIEDLNKKAREHINKKEFEKAIPYLEQAAEQGDIKSRQVLAFLYFKGEFIKPNPEKAFYYYNLLAKDGIKGAQNITGDLYMLGFGVEKDYVKAFELYKKAADQGLAEAQNNLGHFYLTGKGTEKNLEEAVKYYQKAVDQGLSSAQNNLACCYKDGKGVKQDYKKALDYFQKAANSGLSIAKFHIADFYLKGLGVKQDFKKAVEYLKEASEQGPAEAILFLAMCYCNGLGVEKNYNEAFNTLSKKEKVKALRLDTASVFTSLYSLLKNVQDNSEVLEIENIADLPSKIDKGIKVVRITTPTQQKQTILNNTTVNGLYSVEKINQCKLKIERLLQNVENVTPDKSNEFEVFMKIYTTLGNYISTSQNNKKAYKESNLEGAILEQKARCVGIADALRNVLACREINSVSIGGNEHQYNQVCISGKWYYTDLTFDISNIKKREKITNCLLSKEDFMKIDLHHNLDQAGDIHLCQESYDQKIVQKEYKKSLYLNSEKTL